MLSQAIRGNWKSGGVYFNMPVPRDKVPAQTGKISDKKWGQPDWLKVACLRRTSAPDQVIESGNRGLLGVTQAMHVKDMYNPRSLVARAQAFAYLNILKDLWPIGVPKVLEMGCGPLLSLYEIFPHEELPSSWTSFDFVKSFVTAGSQRAQANRWQVNVEQRDAYDLPENSADVLIGQSCYDSIYDMPKALVSAKCAVNPGGLFVHFQEVNPILEASFPFNSRFPDQARTWLTDISDIEFIQGMCRNVPRATPGKDTLLHALSHYEHYVSTLFQAERSRFAFRLPSGEIVTCIDEFQDRLNICLGLSGFSILRSGIAQAIYLGPRMKQHENLPKSDPGNIPVQFRNERLNHAENDGNVTGYGFSPTVREFEIALANGTPIPEPFNDTDLIDSCRNKKLFLEIAFVRYVVAQNQKT